MIGRKVLNWRVQVVHGQTFCYFDPLIERLVIIPLTFDEKSALMECDSGDAFESESESEYSANNKQRDLFRQVPTF